MILWYAISYFVFLGIAGCLLYREYKRTIKGNEWGKIFQIGAASCALFAGYSIICIFVSMTNKMPFGFWFLSTSIAAFCAVILMFAGDPNVS